MNLLYSYCVIPILNVNTRGTSMEVQWLRLHASTGGGMGLIPGWGAKILHLVRPKKKVITRAFNS